jgi:hypothetical protein
VISIAVDLVESAGAQMVRVPKVFPGKGRLEKGKFSELWLFREIVIQTTEKPQTLRPAAFLNQTAIAVTTP